MWHVPQYFNWAWFPEGRSRPYPVTYPTRHEMANMTWQAIAAGANGICGYTFGAFQERDRREHPERSGEELDAFWKDICAVAREVKQMEPVLLGEDMNFPARHLPKALIVRAYRCDDAVYLLVVNRGNERVVANLDISNVAGRSMVTVLGKPIQTATGKLHIDFGGLDYSFVRIRKNGVGD